MNQITVVRYDAFSNQPGKGNPAGIVMTGDSLSELQMQEIAHKVGYNETVFIMESERADLRMRYFTANHEMELCGHGTIAALHCLKTRGLLQQMGVYGDEVAIDTWAGVLPIRFCEQNGELRIRMNQASPQFLPFRGSVSLLAEALGINESEIDDSLPIVYGSTGIWTLLVPIKTLETFSRMSPRNQMFPSILTEMPDASIHPFCLETYNKNMDMHSRHFRAPHSGSAEDAITGTASGVMGAYYGTYIDFGNEELCLLMEQGQELGRDGQVAVHVGYGGSGIEIAISGTAVYADECIIEYSSIVL